MTNFTGTQAQLADHFERAAFEAFISFRSEVATAYRDAAALVRTATIVEEPAPEFHFSNCEIRPRKGASMDVTSGGVSLDRYAIVALELLPPGFWEHVDGAPMPNPLHDAAPDMLVALEKIDATTYDEQLRKFVQIVIAKAKRHPPRKPANTSRPHSSDFDDAYRPDEMPPASFP